MDEDDETCFFSYLEQHSETRPMQSYHHPRHDTTQDVYPLPGFSVVGWLVGRC